MSVLLGGRGAVVCLVTDRTRLLGSERGRGDWRAALLSRIGEAAEAGVDLVQVRERDLDARQLAAFVSDAVATVDGTDTHIVVNDRLDIALACRAHGVHLRADSIPASMVRTIAPRGFLIGRSVHEVGEAAAVAPAVDYLIAGTVFATPSKPACRELLGLDRLGEMARAVRVPVLAIGGITLERIHSVARSGAAGIAAIGLFAGTAGSGRSSDSIGAVVDAIRAAFDTSRSAS